MKSLYKWFITNYLRIIAKLFIRKHHIDFYGITGSAGKTTMTVLLTNIISKKYKVASTFQGGKGLNSETGVPLALLEVPLKGYTISNWLTYMAIATKNYFTLRPKYEKYVIEFGVDKPGDLDFLLSIVPATLGIFTTLAPTHGQNFEKLLKHHPGKTTEDLIFAEKAKLIHSIPKHGWAVLNYDIPKIRNLKDQIDCHVITFGLDPNADITVKNINITPKGTSFTINYKGKDYPATINNFLAGEKTITTILGAIATGVSYEGISMKDCIDAINASQLPPGRMNVFKGIKDTTIIDSSYNSSPIAVEEALNILQSFKRKKIAVLGDMRELGQVEQKEHEKIVTMVHKSVDEVIVIGKAMNQYFYPKYTKSYPKAKISKFMATHKAKKYLKDQLKGREVILIKGSQNELFLESVVAYLLKDKKDEKHLCRRGDHWDLER